MAFCGDLLLFKFKANGVTLASKLFEGSVFITILSLPPVWRHFFESSGGSDIINPSKRLSYIFELIIVVARLLPLILAAVELFPSGLLDRRLRVHHIELRDLLSRRIVQALIVDE